MHKLGQRYSLSNVWNDKIVCVEMNASSEVTGLTDHYIPNIIFNCSHPQLFFIEPLKNHYLYVSFNYWYFSTSIKLKSGKAPNHQNICLCVWWVFFLCSVRGGSIDTQQLFLFPPTENLQNLFMVLMIIFYLRDKEIITNSGDLYYR